MADASIFSKRYVYLHCPWNISGMPPTTVPIPEWRVPMYGPMYVLSEKDIMAALPPGLHVTAVQLTSRSSDEPVTTDTRKGADATPAAR